MVRLPGAALRGIAALAAIPLLLCGAACTSASAPARVEVIFQGPALGTTYQIKVIAETEPPPAARLELDAALLQEIEFVNARMSTYLPESELSRFNASASTEPFPVSAETSAVVAAALEISKQSGGVFDVTVGPLVELWGFGAGERRTKPPSDDEIRTARAAVGWRHLQALPRAVRKTEARLHCDLSAIAKGYAVDRVSEYLSTHGYAGHMVEIGGEIRVAGHNVHGERWRLAIERPERASRSVYSVAELTDLAMATSGNYRNFFEWEGKTYAHTIDPRTGWPVEHELASVTVLSPTCMYADGYATALMAMGLDDGLALANRQHLAALLLAVDAEGHLIEHPSTAWVDTVVATPAAPGASQ